VVEGQHVVSTRKLVDSDAEQHLLEDLLETAKPPLPPEPEFAGLHYLLAAPFRYPPLRWGSRFGRRTERGIWYGAHELHTAFAEAAYYRLVFLEGTTADLSPVLSDVSTFSVPVFSSRAVDLTAAPFAELRGQISSPVHYDESQQLGSDLRAAGVELFRYSSARDARGGACFGVLSPRAFKTRRPSEPEPWYSAATRQAVEFSRRDVFRHQCLRFERAQFLVDGRVPAPAA
jgi:hypothetical protein